MVYELPIAILRTQLAETSVAYRLRRNYSPKGPTEAVSHLYPKWMYRFHFWITKHPVLLISNKYINAADPTGRWVVFQDYFPCLGGARPCSMLVSRRGRQGRR